MKLLKDLAISDTGFVFNPLTGESFSLNETGLFIILQIKQGVDFQEILQSLINEFDVDPIDAEKDLHDFIEMLRMNNLLTA